MPPQQETLAGSFRVRFAWFCPELVLLGFALLILALGLWLKLPASPLDLSSGQEVLHWYFFPLALAVVVHLGILIRSRSSRRSSLFILGVSIPTVVITALCDFQFKAWMPLVNPHRFGPLYEDVDRHLSPVVALCTHFVAWMAGMGMNVSAAYHGCFVLLFFVCFGLHALYDSPTGQRQVMLGVGWILVLGGISYWLAPAVGPFIYRHGADAHATLIQQHMWHKFNFVVQTHQIPAGYFLLPPAAMPSLHVAHTVFFVWMLRRISPRLSLLFVPALLWFMVSAVGLAWHYILDIPAGILLARFAIVLVEAMLPEARAAEPTPVVVEEPAAREELIPA